MTKNILAVALALVVASTASAQKPGGKTVDAEVKGRLKEKTAVDFSKSREHREARDRAVAAGAKGVDEYIRRIDLRDIERFVIPAIEAVTGLPKTVTSATAKANIQRMLSEYIKLLAVGTVGPKFEKQQFEDNLKEITEDPKNPLTEMAEVIGNQYVAARTYTNNTQRSALIEEGLDFAALQLTKARAEAQGIIKKGQKFSDLSVEQKERVNELFKEIRRCLTGKA